MKKLWIGIVLSALLLSACSGDDSKKESEQGVEVNKGIVNVEVTLPAEFFEDQTADEIKAAAKEGGIDEAKVNKDGSVTYKMSKSKHKEMMKEMKEGILSGIDEIKSSEDYPSIKDISHNKDFTKFDVKVDKDAYENSMESFVILTLAYSGTYYNVFNGKSMDDLKVKVNAIDDSTGKVFDTTVFPDDLEEAEKELTEDKE